MDEHVFQQELVLSAIASKCGGLYPQELRGVLEVLMQRGKVALSPQGYCLVEHEKARGSIIQFRRPGNSYAELPEPHPHDYDWRFDAATAQRLANIALRESASEGNILLLGTPTVLVRAPLFTRGTSYDLARSESLVDRVSLSFSPTPFV